ncbi:regulatory protein RecX [Nisaea denitrificans]|uniref:regulatory protein RecX n=1 Tax=Nisaea denitrificans TaxID=390877 RepID=UPI0003FB39E2|nr:RecX family transcriptional regulator [Nisaea denitrificans]
MNDFTDGGGDGRSAGKKRREKKPPKPITESYLRNVALWYMERYASSAANLKAVLMRRVRLSSAHHGSDPAEGAEMVDAVVQRYTEAGILNDRLFAETRVRSLVSRGTSTKMIRRKLMEKGVSSEDIDAALAEVVDQENGELASAARYARRRRIGPFRLPEKREENRDRDMAALARQGFGFGIAAKVVDAESPEALEEEIEGTDGG